MWCFIFLLFVHMMFSCSFYIQLYWEKQWSIWWNSDTFDGTSVVVRLNVCFFFYSNRRKLRFPFTSWCYTQGGRIKVRCLINESLKVNWSKTDYILPGGLPYLLLLCCASLSNSNWNYMNQENRIQCNFMKNQMNC